MRISLMLYESSLNGPVPMGALLAGQPATVEMSAQPSYTCLGMIGASVTFSCCRSGAYGCGNRKITVSGSGVSSVQPAEPIDALVREWKGSRAFSKLNFTSSDVNGSPSCHFTPLRRVNV